MLGMRICKPIPLDERVMIDVQELRDDTRYLGQEDAS